MSIKLGILSHVLHYVRDDWGFKFLGRQVKVTQ